MNRTEKHQTVESLNARLQAVNSLFLIDYTGLKVVDATELRRKVRGMNGSYLVVKNTLASRAAKETGAAQLESYFEGPTAIAYHPKDVVGLAKLLTELARSNPALRFKAALVEGKVIPAEQIQSLASMPSREVLLSQLLGMLKAPLQRLVGALNSPVRDLCLALKAIKK
jgi:large subunit ribosomal protein L10